MDLTQNLWIEGKKKNCPHVWPRENGRNLKEKMEAKGSSSSGK